jgi:hypothetical protein
MASTVPSRRTADQGRKPRWDAGRLAGVWPVAADWAGHTNVGLIRNTYGHPLPQ